MLSKYSYLIVQKGDILYRRHICVRPCSLKSQILCVKTICKLLKNTNRIWKRRFCRHKTRTIYWLVTVKCDAISCRVEFRSKFWSGFATIEQVRGFAPKQDTWQCAYKPGHGVLRILISILDVVLVKQNTRHYYATHIK